MTFDRYTKFLLTIIAIALVVIAFRVDFKNPAAADVAGMDSYDLKGDDDFRTAVRLIVEDAAKDDRDFKKAVGSIVEDCVVDGERISC